MFKFFPAHSTLLQSPEDTEVVVGQDVTLKCRTDVNNSTSSVEWRYQAHPDALFETICKRKLIFGRFKGRYDVVQNTTTGQYDLIIKLVQLHDAGRYKCSHRESQSEAELVVFGKQSNNVVANLTDFIVILCGLCDLMLQNLAAKKIPDVFIT